MRPRAFAAGLTCLVLCSLVAGCGDDEGGSDGGAGNDGAGAGGTGGGGNGGGGTGGRQMLPDFDGGEPDAGPGEVPEGGPCATPDDCGLSEAGDPLTCVNSGGFGVCARPCSVDEDCGTEICDSPYTMLAEDAHCIDLVITEFEFCGGVVTSLCSAEAGLTCFLYSDAPLGVCMTQCIAAADDAGVTDTVCKSDQVCATSALSGGDGTEGVCGLEVARGGECGSELGKFCADEADVCAADDPTNVDSPITCHQRCTSAASPCDEGTCMQFRTTFYCR